MANDLKIYAFPFSIIQLLLQNKHLPPSRLIQTSIVFDTDHYSNLTEPSACHFKSASNAVQPTRSTRPNYVCSRLVGLELRGLEL